MVKDKAREVAPWPRDAAGRRWSPLEAERRSKYPEMTEVERLKGRVKWLDDESKHWYDAAQVETARLAEAETRARVLSEEQVRLIQDREELRARVRLLEGVMDKVESELEAVRAERDALKARVMDLELQIVKRES